MEHSYILFEGDTFEKGLVSDECIEVENRGSCEYPACKPHKKSQRLARFQQEQIEKFDTDIILYF